MPYYRYVWLMSETTLTPLANNDTKGVLYANKEMAWFSDDTIGSSTMYSTAIAFWSYNIISKEFVVKYRSSDTYYTYEQVPYSVIFDLMFADSLGAFIAKEIKPLYSVA